MATSYMYRREVFHKGLGKYRVIKAASKYELEQKVHALEVQWDDQWMRKCEIERKKTEKEEKIRNDEESLEYANEKTQEAEKIQEKIENILRASLIPKPLDIEKLKNKEDFKVKPPTVIIDKEIPKEPRDTDAKYNPKKPFLALFFQKKAEDYKNECNLMFKNDWNSWIELKKTVENDNVINRLRYDKDLANWQTEKEEYNCNRERSNADIDRWIEDYKKGDPESISEYYVMVINEIEKPFEYECHVSAEYISDNKMLILDVQLPNIEDIPKLKKVTYVKSNKEMKNTYLSEANIKKKYDDILYQIVLQTLNYVFVLDGDYCNINSIVLNGKLKTIDKSTGKNIEPYVLSINVTKENFNGLNLQAIDPKAWFKSAKGISAAFFADITPVAPVVLMSREDSRFIDGYTVTDQLDCSVNLATIDWKDFENLIREIFEQEFNINGGEVKITQASRDGGVDAVAFDPDPIRGGKIVIQAKRYTNVVGVSAVRDLYGTVMNEGATKGILVTTSNYGSDAYNFASGKPLTLMNGANLLYLLEKHGHKARIDLQEAKEFANNV
jgi:restriction system protein